MATIGQRIRQRRKEIKMSQEELAIKLKYSSRTSVSKIERGDRQVPIQKVAEFADVLGTTTAWLMGWKTEEEKAMQDVLPLTEKKIVLEDGSEMKVGMPILGNITADFVFAVKDDAMVNAKIGQGDIAFIRKANVPNGGIGLVSVKGKTTIRRIFRDEENHKLILSAENPNFPPLFFANNELKDVAVVGRVVAVLIEI